MPYWSTTGIAFALLTLLVLCIAVWCSLSADADLRTIRQLSTASETPPTVTLGSRDIHR